jgi:uncharacterized membrane protein
MRVYDGHPHTLVWNIVYKLTTKNMVAVQIYEIITDRFNEGRYYTRANNKLLLLLLLLVLVLLVFYYYIYILSVVLVLLIILILITNKNQTFSSCR